MQLDKGHRVQPLGTVTLRSLEDGQPCLATCESAMESYLTLVSKNNPLEAMRKVWAYAIRSRLSMSRDLTLLGKILVIYSIHRAKGDSI